MRFATWRRSGSTVRGPLALSLGFAAAAAQIVAVSLVVVALVGRDGSFALLRSSLFVAGTTLFAAAFVLLWRRTLAVWRWPTVTATVRSISPTVTWTEERNDASGSTGINTYFASYFVAYEYVFQGQQIPGRWSFKHSSGWSELRARRAAETARRHRRPDSRIVVWIDPIEPAHSRAELPSGDGPVWLMAIASAEVVGALSGDPVVRGMALIFLAPAILIAAGLALRIGRARRTDAASRALGVPLREVRVRSEYRDAERSATPDGPSCERCGARGHRDGATYCWQCDSRLRS
jgi:hypothetical protein